MLLAKVPVIDKFVGAIAASNGVPSFLVPIAAILGGKYMGKKVSLSLQIRFYQSFNDCFPNPVLAHSHTEMIF